MGRFVVEAKGSGWYFDLKATNGEIILSASEIYSEKDACLNGIGSVKTNSFSEVEDQTVSGYVILKHPKYEVYEDKAGEYRFRLLALNGQNIGRSEGYKTKQSCMNGIESVKKNAPDAKIEFV